MPDLNQQIQDAVIGFSNKITMLACEAAAEQLRASFAAIAARTTQAQPPARPTPTPATKPPSSMPLGATPGQKRDPKDIVALVERLNDYIKAHPGQRVEQINKGLGTKTSQVALPLAKLTRANQVTRTGTRRATRYFPAATEVAKPTGRRLVPVKSKKARR